MKGNVRTLPIDAEVGFACDAGGWGVAYARVRRDDSQQLLRVGFRLNRCFEPRAVPYAAVTAVARTLQRRGVRRVRLAIDDVPLVVDLTHGADVSGDLVLPYVRLKCALNGFDDVQVLPAESCELAQRARAEVALHSAA